MITPKDLQKELIDFKQLLNPLTSDPRLEQEMSRKRFNYALLIEHAIQYINRSEMKISEQDKKIQEQAKLIFELRCNYKPHLNKEITQAIDSIIAELEEMKGEYQ